MGIAGREKRSLYRTYSRPGKEVQIMRKYLAALAACLMAAAMFTGCQKEAIPPVDTEAAQQATAGVAETENMDVQEMPEETEQVYTGTIEISTKFGKLYYQDQWEDFMRVEIMETDSRATVAFVAEIENVRYALFQLVLGQGDGEAVGQITDDQGVKHDVFVTMEEISGIDSLTEGEQNRLFAMQEEINYIIESLE